MLTEPREIAVDVRGEGLRVGGGEATKGHRPAGHGQLEPVEEALQDHAVRSVRTPQLSTLARTRASRTDRRRCGRS
jgi:hypothetical protein